MNKRSVENGNKSCTVLYVDVFSYKNISIFRCQMKFRCLDSNQPCVWVKDKRIQEKLTHVRLDLIVNKDGIVQ